MTWARLRGDLAESAPQRYVAHPAMERKGYDPDIPEGGTTANQQSAASAVSRREDIDDLYGAYTGCAPLSTGIDAIARTITAGGVRLRPRGSGPEKLVKLPDKLPPAAQAVQDLLDFVNPDQDIRQLMRNVIVDLLVTGDAFVEVTWAMGVPVALWNLDSATTTPIADVHGTITEYVQQLGPSRVAHFEPHEVIHIKLDAPRGGVYGLSPTRKLMPAVLSYIWTQSLLKATMKKGNPPRLHFKFTAADDAGSIKRFRQQFSVRHIGPENLGTPITTKGADVQELKASAIAEYLSTLDHQRDVILQGLGVPGRKVGVAEPGHLGGSGADLGADRTFELNTCHPIGELVMEKFNFVVMRAYGVSDYDLDWGEVDEREELEAEQIRDMRLRNGTWTLNRVRAEVGEPPVDGGDVAVLVDRQNLVAWSDLPALSRANVEAVKAKGAEPPDDDDDEPAAAGGAGAKPGQGARGVTPVTPTVGKSAEADDFDVALLERALRVHAALSEVMAA